MGIESSPSSLSYRDAGVDIDAAEDALDLAKPAIRSTFGDRVLADVGSFGGLFRADGLGAEPVLVATADGVGTKVRIATAVERFDTVGRCLVQHCINDALVQGAEPLFFLDYVGVGKMDQTQVSKLIIGLADACRDNGLTLIGGETAEMPGVYPEGEFDLVGTLVGVVEREHLLDGTRVEPGDVLIGLPSDGLHTNGYSLARRIVEERMGLAWTDPFPNAGGNSVADELLRCHRSYLSQIRPFLKDSGLHSLAHITGGGMTGNLPRTLNGHGALVNRSSVPKQIVFEELVAAGEVEIDEAWRAFNMGVGMVLIVDPGFAEEVESTLNKMGESHFRMGSVIEGTGVVAWAD
ncbi:MAG: phosphoribosylformylglycinamidine cyclo-ligase [Planctomycetes bacterium]|nr:phosphoribosylformylglycinamidine cyclo-ligase [Planctomycetota bacterium]